MPKRVGNIYERMSDPAFIARCIRIGTVDSKKKRRRDVRRVLADREGYIEKMQTILETMSYVPRIPTHRKIYDESGEKWREISSVPFFPDGLMHVMLVQAMMGDVLMRGMSHWSCASVPGRGCRRIKERIERAMRSDVKGTKYALEIDIKSYYPSISLDRLMTAYERKIKDRKFLTLLALCLTCAQVSLGDAIADGADWRKITAGATGIDIGFYLNQWSANYFLEPLDNLIYTIPGVKYVARYMDNITILGPNKKKLRQAREAIEVYLRDHLGLTIKSTWQVYPTKSRMVSAVGYRYAHTHTILRKRNFLRLTRQCRRVMKKLAAGVPIGYKQAAGLLSRIGQLKHCNSFHIREKYVDPIGLKALKEVVRYESKRRQSAQQRIHAGRNAEKSGAPVGTLLRECPAV